LEDPWKKGEVSQEKLEFMAELAKNEGWTPQEKEKLISLPVINQEIRDLKKSVSAKEEERKNHPESKKTQQIEELLRNISDMSANAAETYHRIAALRLRVYEARKKFQDEQENLIEFFT
jgi:hypothetical protein